MDELIKHRRIVCIVGKTGYGKSRLLKSGLSEFPRVVVFDLLAEYEYEAGKIFTTFDEFRSYLKSVRGNSEFFCILRFESMDEYESAMEAIYIVTNVTLIIEELSNFSESNKVSPSLEKMLRFGRHRAISIVGTTQRYGDLDGLLRNNIDALFCFRVSGANDLKLLANTPMVGKAGAVALSSLKRDEYLVFTN